ncbi:MAG TPA: helix-turn-helix domain-containing protein [Gemmatimonadales bacterium]|nr:helix-turn-helix domain-containing protein [Gemmatimonadales bacterium]
MARTLDLVGDRWTLLIIRDLFLGKTRFSQFRESTPAPPPKLLSERLQRLERHGLVERAVYSQRPLRAEYRLTPKGQALSSVVREMVAWGLENTFSDEESGLRKAIEERLATQVHEMRDA